MIFDFYLSIDFSPTGTPEQSVRFRAQPEYEDIVGSEVSGALRNGYFTCLHRRDYSDCFAETEEKKLWLYGYAYTNKAFADQQQRIPEKLTASDLLTLYLSWENDFVLFLKGSYVLVVVDEAASKVEVITDRLNVLPLYYAYQPGRLVLSSNTALILQADWVNREVDKVAIAMQQLFDYTLGEYYFVKGIRRFENARRYVFTRQGKRTETYWDVSELYHQQLLPKWEALEQLAVQLKENVNLYAADADKVLLSLTGGFDGRTNLALLDRPVEDFLCYSYGMPGSKQIKTPQEIARQLGINYKPIYLEQDFLDEYYQNTLRATYFSNGTAPIGFCNKPYAYRSLGAYSDTILTGLFGSEILRPLHNNGIQINDQSFDIFLAMDVESGVQRAIKRAANRTLLKDDGLQESQDALIDFFRKNYFDKYPDHDRITRFFFFVIQEGIRKYFSQEISLERVFVTTKFPYFDGDLVNLIYQTTWAGMYNGFLGKSKFKRRKGQLLYAYIIRKYKPALGRILLDRGYTPNDLLLPFPINFLKIGVGVLKAKAYIKKAGGNDTFKTEIWAQPTIRTFLDLRERMPVPGLEFEESVRSFPSFLEDRFLTCRHLISLFVFLTNVLHKNAGTAKKSSSFS